MSYQQHLDIRHQLLSRSAAILSTDQGEIFFTTEEMSMKIFPPHSLEEMFHNVNPVFLTKDLYLKKEGSDIFLSKKTLHVKAKGHIDALKSVHNIETVFKKGLFVIYFLGLFAWNILFQFVPALMVEKFSATSSVIGDVSALMGLMWIVGTACFSWLLHTHIKLKTLLFLTTLCFALASVFVTFPENMLFFLLVIGAGVFFAGGMWPLFTLAISNTAHGSLQGRILGVSQSVQSLSMMLAPILGGLLFQIYIGVPFFFASIIALLSALFLLKVKI